MRDYDRRLGFRAYLRERLESRMRGLGLPPNVPHPGWGPQPGNGAVTPVQIEGVGGQPPANVDVNVDGRRGGGEPTGTPGGPQAWVDGGRGGGERTGTPGGPQPPVQARQDTTYRRPPVQPNPNSGATAWQSREEYIAQVKARSALKRQEQERSRLLRKFKKERRDADAKNEERRIDSAFKRQEDADAKNEELRIKELNADGRRKQEEELDSRLSGGGRSGTPPGHDPWKRQGTTEYDEVKRAFREAAVQNAVRRTEEEELAHRQRLNETNQTAQELLESYEEAEREVGNKYRGDVNGMDEALAQDPRNAPVNTPRPDRNWILRKRLSDQKPSASDTGNWQSINYEYKGPIDPLDTPDSPSGFSPSVLPQPYPEEMTGYPSGFSPFVLPQQYPAPITAWPTGTDPSMAQQGHIIRGDGYPQGYFDPVRGGRRRSPGEIAISDYLRDPSREHARRLKEIGIISRDARIGELNDRLAIVRELTYQQIPASAQSGSDQWKITTQGPPEMFPSVDQRIGIEDRRRRDMPPL